MTVETKLTVSICHIDASIQQQTALIYLFQLLSRLPADIVVVGFRLDTK
jgi:hypothetical protein